MWLTCFVVAILLSNPTLPNSLIAKQSTKSVWAVGYKASSPPRRDEWEGHAGKVREEVVSRMKERHGGQDDEHPVWECLEKTSDDRLLHFGLFDRKHKKRWSKGR